MVTLEQLVPSDNFTASFQIKYQSALAVCSYKKYYGQEGQESIGSISGFKMCIVGYINNTKQLNFRKLADLIVQTV